MWFSLKSRFPHFFKISRKNWDFRQNTIINLRVGAHAEIPEIHGRSPTGGSFWSRFLVFLDSVITWVLGQNMADFSCLNLS